MTQESWPLQGSAADESRIRTLFRHFNGADGSGVIAGILNELAVTAGGGQSVDVDTGEAIVDGIYYSNDAVVNLTFSDADATDDRIDTVVLRLTPSAGDTDGQVEAAIVEGTPAEGAPTLTQDLDGTFEYPLFDYTVAAGAGVPSNFVDRRDLVSRPAFDYSTAPADGDTWIFDAASGLWLPGSGSLDDLSDVDTAGGSTGDVLTQQGDGTFALDEPSGTHIEAKETPGSATSESVTWTTAFASTPVVTAAAVGGEAIIVWVSSRSTTGATLDDDAGGFVKMAIAMEAT